MAYVAGAFAGFAGEPMVAVGAVVLAVVIALVQHRLDYGGLAVALAAGALVASAAARDDRECLRRLRLQPELARTDWHAVLEASAAPGAGAAPGAPPASRGRAGP